VYGYFYRFNQGGVWKRLMEQLNGNERKRQGRHKEPSAGCADSQSVKTATQGETVDYDGGKKVKGRKRHLLVDTLGLILGIIVTAADTGDRQGSRTLLSDYCPKGVRRLRKIWADSNYTGGKLAKWERGLKKTHKVDLVVVERESKGFHVVKRWRVVEKNVFLDWQLSASL
jgi:putative transposase